ncbi:hypothetical protein [Edaphobacter albus]|uniref:hypothetical protein n=1 Tax=Edaphobacter sp. 4G125 TaxID=2763071 RepID=UPI0016483AA5|nr:hypothetical protein [Edaphobacter sp. 4G125]QNI36199.1 hypothetical protein H7846_14595 [Edaphobacter sp. 4G125]
MPIPAKHEQQLKELQQKTSELLTVLEGPNAKAALEELLISAEQQHVTEENAHSVFQKHGVKLPVGAKLTVSGGQAATRQGGGIAPARGRPPICVMLCVAISAGMICVHYREDEGFGLGGC